jgi:hypothetical protein
MSRHLPPMGCLMLLCVLTAPGAATAEAAGIGVHWGGMRKTFRERLRGDAIRMAARRRRRK